MQPLRRLAVPLAFASVLIAGSALAQDAVKTSPTLYKVLLENDQVRVLEFSLKPGGKEPMHSHPDGVVYILSAGKAKSTGPDGKSEIIESKPGTAVWGKAVTHSWESIGPGDGHVIIVELKGSKSATPAPAKKQPK